MILKFQSISQNVIRITKSKFHDGKVFYLFNHFLFI